MHQRSISDASATQLLASALKPLSSGIQKANLTFIALRGLKLLLIPDPDGYL
jgi:hypothetical protein